MNTSTPDFFDIANSICQFHGFSILHEIGGGGFKQVYMVECPDKSFLALKIIRIPNFSPRTEREIDSLNRCNHNSIAKLISVGKFPYNGNEYSYLFEEYLSGGSLGDRLKANGLLDDQSSYFLGYHLIDVLQHLFDLGLVHRDIKPDNIMYRSNDQIPVLVDFGIVRDLSASSLTQTWASSGPGTPYFASPEQLNNQKYLIDWRSDQFSLAVTVTVSRFGIHPYQYPNEPPFSQDTIIRVANRGNRDQLFYKTISSFSPNCLSKMTEPWSIKRFRLPDELARNWGK
jgi:serine/threonine protein kinase